MAIAALATGCSSAAAVRVTPPPGPDPAACARLADALPDELDGRNRRDTEPASARTAAWGNPAVVLRCGVPRPPGLTATSEVIEVEDVGWFLDERPRAFVFTTVGRSTHVEVRVPGATPREQATSPLVDLAGPVAAAVPGP